MELNAVFEVSRKNATLSMRENDQTVSVTLQPADMNRLLKWMVHSLEVFCWSEDYGLPDSDEVDAEWADGEDGDEADDVEETDLSLCWQLDISYRNGESQQVSSTDPAPDRVLELVQELLSHLHSEDELT